MLFTRFVDIFMSNGRCIYVERNSRSRSSKAQTTRHRILGIVNGDDFQVVLSDTPGIIKPAYELQTSMMHFVKSAFEDADILIYMVEIGEKS